MHIQYVDRFQSVGCIHFDVRNTITAFFHRLPFYNCFSIEPFLSIYFPLRSKSKLQNVDSKNVSVLDTCSHLCEYFWWIIKFEKWTLPLVFRFLLNSLWCRLCCVHVVKRKRCTLSYIVVTISLSLLLPNL